MQTPYNKLVRDRVPEIIAAQGNAPHICTLDETRYMISLREKLSEELNEYLESGDTMELCDMLEVIYALAQAHGLSHGELENMRQGKALERGVFDDRIYLVGVD